MLYMYIYVPTETFGLKLSALKNNKYKYLTLLKLALVHEFKTQPKRLTFAQQNHGNSALMNPSITLER